MLDDLNKNLNQESNTKENTSSIIKNTNSKNHTSLNLKQKDISINQEINNTKEQDFNLLFDKITIQNNIIFKGKKLA